jgi:pimeloyl-ACP methyl ester carboxylesterase
VAAPQAPSDSADPKKGLTVVTTEIHTQTRKADGLEIRYAWSHAHDEPTMLLLSPWPESIYAWEQLWPRLTSAGHVVAIDLPGFGHSEGRTDLFSPQAMGRFVVRLIDEWELGAPHIFGPDVGGPTALFAAVEAPSSLTSAIVGNGATSYPLEVRAISGTSSATPISIRCSHWMAPRSPNSRWGCTRPTRSPQPRWRTT